MAHPGPRRRRPEDFADSPPTFGSVAMAPDFNADGVQLLPVAPPEITVVDVDFDVNASLVLKSIDDGEAGERIAVITTVGTNPPLVLRVPTHQLPDLAAVLGGIGVETREEEVEWRRTHLGSLTW